MNKIFIIIFILLCIIILFYVNENFQNFNINLVEYKITNDPFIIYDEINNLHLLNFKQQIYDINEIDYVVYATFNNKIIGFCLLKEISNEFESVIAIYSLNVLKEYRNYGIASNIISFVKQFVKNLNNQHDIVLGVTDNSLIPFYQKNKFYIYNNHHEYHKKNKYIIPHKNIDSYIFMRHRQK